VPTANETPEIETYFLNIPDPDGPYGAKEGSLGFGLGLHGAVASAIHDATGVWINEIPITPDKMLRALEEKDRDA
jgi:CO/xanthine dehydrogenase Mo-binding subunit